MIKKFVLVAMLLSIPVLSWGADSTIWGLGTELTAPVGTDLLPVGADPGGSPATKKMTLNTLRLIKILNASSSCTIGSDCDSTSSDIAYGGIIMASTAITITLPAVTIGMSICVYSTDATAKVVDPNASDGIRNGTATRNADGHKMTSGGSAGDFVCLVGDSADGWTVLGKSGTWTDE